MLGELEQIILLRIILSNPGIYLNEVQSKLFDKFGFTISCSNYVELLNIWVVHNKSYRE